MKSNRTSFFVVILLFLAPYGCAFKSDVEALHNRIVYLERQLSEERQKSAAAEKRDARIEQRIAAVAQTRELKEDEIRSQSATLGAMFDGFREEILTLTGRIEEVEHSLKRTENRYQRMEQSLNARVGKLEEYLNFEDPVIMGRNRSQGSDVRSSPAKKAPVRSEQPEQSAGSPPVPDKSPIVRRSESREASIEDQAENLFSSEEELYMISKQTFDSGDYKSAREGFETLLKHYPDSQFADNAQFWIGDSYYRENDYRKAIVEYTKVIRNYPDGNKVRNALLKQAFSFYNLGDKENAKLILEDLVNKYPNSGEAAIATRKLEAM